MKFSDLPPDTRFYDIDGIAVAVLPDATHLAFSPGGDGGSRPYPLRTLTAMSDMGDRLSRDEFVAWLKQGFNRFDAC